MTSGTPLYPTARTNGVPGASGAAGVTCSLPARCCTAAAATSLTVTPAISIRPKSTEISSSRSLALAVIHALAFMVPLFGS